MEREIDFIFLSSRITADGDYSHEIRRYLLLGWKTMTNLDNILKSRHYFAYKGPYCQSYGFSSSHVRMWELDNKKGWAPNCGAGEDSRVPCTARTLNQSILKEINPEYSLEGLMLKLKLQILWPPGAKSNLIGKDLDAGKNWRQEKETTGEMVTWHHWLNGHELEQTPRDGKGQESLVCCSPWGRKESDMTEWTTKANFICDFFKYCIY